MIKKYIIIFLISMIPLIELRGAIPVALAPEAAEVHLLGMSLHGLGLPVIWSYVVWWNWTELYESSTWC